MCVCGGVDLFSEYRRMLVLCMGVVVGGLAVKADVVDVYRCMVSTHFTMHMSSGACPIILRYEK